MADADLWPAASGCCACPSAFEIGSTWGETQTLPGFEDPSRGYFSFPLGTSYLPMPLREDLSFLPDMVVGEIDRADLGRFLAIATHEAAGHAFINDKIGRRLHRLFGAHAYEQLWHIMYGPGNDRDAWGQLEITNRSIARLTRATVLLDEWFALRRGFIALREYGDVLREHSTDSLAGLEDEFVHAQAAAFGETLGARFRRLYRGLSEVWERAGELPLHFMAAYSDAGYEVTDQYSVPGNQTFLFKVFSEGDVMERSLERLERALDLFSGTLPYSRAELQRWTERQWAGFFGRWLPLWDDWARRYNETYTALITSMQVRMEWWDDRGMGTCNPVAGAQVAATGEFAIGLADPKHMVTDGVSLNDNPDEYWRRFGQALLDAASRDTILTHLICREGDYSLCFLPHFHRGGSPPDLCSHFAIRWSDSGADDAREHERKWTEYEHVWRDTTASAVFFEGIRLMVASGRGLQCPMRSATRSGTWMLPSDRRVGSEAVQHEPCCGMVEPLARLWDAAGARGLSEGSSSRVSKWIRPNLCLDLPTPPAQPCSPAQPRFRR